MTLYRSGIRFNQAIHNEEDKIPSNDYYLGLLQKYGDQGTDLAEENGQARTKIAQKTGDLNAKIISDIPGNLVKGKDMYYDLEKQADDKSAKGMALQNQNLGLQEKTRANKSAMAQDAYMAEENPLGGTNESQILQRKNFTAPDTAIDLQRAQAEKLRAPPQIKPLDRVIQRKDGSVYRINDNGAEELVKASPPAPADALKSALMGAQIGKIKAQTNKIQNAPKPSEKPSVGENEVDKKFAPEYDDWRASGGYAAIQKNLQILQEARNKLVNSKSISGPFVGAQPDWLKARTTPESIDVQQKIQSVAQGTVKQIVGPRVTQQELNQVMERAYNPSLDEKYNIQRLDAVVGELTQKARAKQAAVDYWEKNHGTLRGFSGTGGFSEPPTSAHGPAGGMPAAMPSSGSKTSSNAGPASGMVKMYNPLDGSTKMVPVSSVEKYVSRGMKIVQ